jgi:pyrophosphatase PpaX
MKLKGFIFDLDGTLLNTIPVCYVAFRKTFQKYLGRHYSDQEIASLFGPTEEGIFKKILPHCWQDALADYLTEYEKEQKGSTPFPGIVDILTLLKSNHLRLAIVSGKGLASMNISLNETGLSPFFETVITGSETGAEKPFHIRQVLKAWKIAPEEAAYIGDTVYDVKAAKEVGLLPIGALWARTAEIKEITAAHPFVYFTETAAFSDWIQNTIVSSGK